MTIGLDISVLNDRQRTGIAVYTYNLIDALLRINHTDKFILFGISTFEAYDFLKNLPFKNYPNVEMKIYRMPSRLFRLAFLLWQRLNWPPIENFVGKADIFHSFNWYLPPQRNGKVVATVFDMTPLLFPKMHLAKTIQLEKIRMRRIAKNADLVITISENSKKDFLKVYPQMAVEIIYPGVSKNFKNVREDPKVLKKFDLKPGYILSVGTLEPRKNIQGLVKAYLMTKQNSPLIIVGAKGWEAQKVWKLSKNSDKIKILGFVDDRDLPTLYKGALMFVYPSFYEGFGLPPLEALSCGTPVICSNTSSLKEVGGDAVFYINSQNISEIKSALIKIETNPTLRKELIKKGLKQAKKFSWEKSAVRLNELYHEFD